MTAPLDAGKFDLHAGEGFIALLEASLMVIDSGVSW
jgi:hypothetical protein